MSQPNILRLGICGCAAKFHGRFEKQTITVNNATLHIQEVIIAEEDHRRDIRASRAHFFLDFHTYNQGKISTSLFRVELMPNGKGGERMYFGSHYYKQVWRNRWYATSIYIPRSKRILNAIQTILAAMDAREFKKWRARMA